MIGHNGDGDGSDGHTPISGTPPAPPPNTLVAHNHPYIEISAYGNKWSKDKGRHVPSPYPYSTDLYTEIIRTRDGHYSDVIAKMMAITNPDERSEFKAKSLHSYTISCVVSYRHTSSIIKYTDLINIDIDSDSNADVVDWGDVRDDLFFKDDRIVAVWLSARKQGLSIVYRCDHNFHQNVFATIERDFKEQHGLQIDTVTHDIVRLRFVSYDKGIKFRDNFSEIPPYKHDPEVRVSSNRENRVVIVDDFSQYRESAIGACMQMIAASKDGEKHKNLIKASFLMGGFIAAQVVDEPTGAASLKAAIIARGNIRNRAAAFETINNGITQGKKHPKYDTVIKISDWDGLPVNGQTPIDISYKVVDIKSDTDYLITFSHIPKEHTEVLKLNNVTILEVGNISSLIAPPGTGKSHTCEAIVSSFLNPDSDSFKFSYHKKDVKKVLFIDTERPWDDCHRSLKRIRKRVGDDVALDRTKNMYERFVFSSFLMMPKFDDRLKKLEYYCKCGEYGLIIIDGIGDLVKETNDETEAKERISTLIAWANQYSLSFFITIHDNPSTNKSKPRGHIGSELLRKSQCALLLSKDEEDKSIRLLTTNFDHGKNRNDSDNIDSYFKWNEEKKMFLSHEREHVDVKSKPKKGVVDTIYVLGKIYELSDGITKDEFISRYVKHAQVSKQSAYKAFDSMMASDTIYLKDGFYVWAHKNPMDMMF